MVLGAVHRELQAKIKQATAEASAMATNSPRKDQSSTNSVASWIASAEAPHAQNVAAADQGCSLRSSAFPFCPEGQAADLTGVRSTAALADPADAAATVDAAPTESAEEHAKEGAEAGMDGDLAGQDNNSDPGIVTRWDNEGAMAGLSEGLGDEEGVPGVGEELRTNGQRCGVRL
eukprot:1146218-Pelagomonas_calceolata.AAC.11